MGSQEEHARALDDDRSLTHRQIIAIHRARAMQVLPAVPRIMPIQQLMRRAAFALWALAPVVYAAVLLWRSILPFSIDVPAIIAILGAACWMLSYPIGRIEARRLVVPRGGLVCPVCLYPLDKVQGEKLCPECATWFDPSAVISVWRSSYGLRAHLTNPDVTDLHALLRSARQARESKDKAAPAANDVAHE